MSKYYIPALVSCLVLSSCIKEDLFAPVEVNTGFTAEIESFDGSTKTSLNEQNSIEWSENDRIAIFQGFTIADVFEVTSASAGKTKGTFKEVASEGGDGFVSGTEITDNIAVYPYYKELECSNGVLSDGELRAYKIENVYYPINQRYQAESFPDDAFVMVAVTNGVKDKTLKFRNASGALRLRIKGTTAVKTISITGNDNEPIAGYATVIAYKDSSSPGIERSDIMGYTVNLYCEDGVQLDENTPTEFIMALPPTVFEKGFTVRITDVNDVVSEHITAKRNVVNRSRILNMPEITFGKSGSSADGKDYVDEYGVNHGKGTEIDGVIWAPVNCGYHKTDYKYGKLYQWGRKYGQGYSGDIYNVNGSKTGTYSDNTVPTIQSGPVTLSTGQSSSNKNCFYKVTSSPYDWLYSPDDKLWNSGTEENPIKAEYDPCPDGWRIPTYAELDELRSNRSSWTTNDAGQAGYWFSGSTSYSATASRIFLPAAGCRFTSADYADARGYYGYYWSSIPGNDNAYHLLFYGGYANMSSSSRALGYSVRCVQDDAELIAVSSLTLSKTSLSLDVSKTATLSATITPSNANHQSAHWWSDNENIATVDQNGKVTAVSAGTTTITAMAGMQTATCTVTVTSTSSKQKDYVDEYGVNHGKGTEIDGVIWAPVNCGYHKTDYKYGKLYQWGRKYGQGYSGGLYDVNGYRVGEVSDATVPTIEEGGVSVITGNHKSKGTVFYTGNGSLNYDWVDPQDDKLWNSGTESKPVKTEYDPCPEGWRVPTYAELNELHQNRSSWTSKDGQNGYWFSGASSYTDKVPQVFFPAAGSRGSRDGHANSRGDFGSYWSSRPISNHAYSLYFTSSFTDVGISYRAYGYSVRCVQD